MKRQERFKKCLVLIVFVVFIFTLQGASFAENAKNNEAEKPAEEKVSAQAVTAQSIPSEPTSRFSLSSAFAKGLGDSVDPSSGALVIKQTDILLPGKGGLDLGISRSYNSKSFGSSAKWNSFKRNIWEWKTGMEFRIPTVVDRWGGWMGRGWQSSIGGELVVSICSLNLDLTRLRYKPLDFENRIIVQVNSSSYIFDKNLSPLDKGQRTVLKEVPNGYVLITKDGIKYRFEKRYYYKVDLYDDYSSVFTNEYKYLSVAYYLSSIENLNGNTIEFIYEKFGDGFEDGYKKINWIEVFGIRVGSWGHWEKRLKYYPFRPVKIIDSFGREINIYYKSNTSEDIKASMIDRISYKDSNGNALTYQYVYDGNNCLKEVIPPQGNSTKFDYTLKNEGLGEDFEDDGYILTRMTYPIGGTVNYSYDWYNPKDYAPNLIEKKAQALSSYVVSRRTVNSSHSWNYSYGNGELYSRYGIDVKPDEEYEEDKGEAWNFDEVIVIDPVGETEYKFEKGLIKREDNAEGHVTDYTWDYDEKNLLSVTENRGGTIIKTEYKDYDDYGNYGIRKEYGDLSNISDDRELHFKYAHDTNSIYKTNHIVNRVSHARMIKDGKTLNEVYSDYDSEGRGNLVQKREILDSGTAITSYSYDSSGNLIRVVDPNSNGTSYRYAAGSPNPTYISHLLTQSKQYYFHTGLLKSESDYNGYLTSYEYDRLGRPTKKTNPGGSTVTYTYYDSTNRVDVKDENNNIVIYRYDNLGRLIEVNQPEGFTISYQYNPFSKIISVTEAGKRTSYSYDKIGRFTSVTYPDGSSISCDYIDNQNAVEVMDGERNTSKYKYDGLGQLIEVTEADGRRTTYRYTGSGQISKVTDARGLYTEYTYDRQGGLVGIKHSDGTTNSFKYDKAGNLMQKKDAKGQNVYYRYDRINRLKRINYPNSAYDVIYTYDEASSSNGKGQLTSRRDISGRTDYSYDRRRRLGSKRQTIGSLSSNMTYSYDNIGNIKSIQDPIGSLKTYYVYDDLNRITEVKRDTGSAQKTMAFYSYNTNGTIKDIQFLNGMKMNYAYDRRDRLDTLRVSDRSGNELLKHDYDYDSVGNRTALNIANIESISYNYDKVYRLTEVEYMNSEGDSEFSYDSAGNRTEFKYPYGDIEYYYNLRSNQLDYLKLNQHGKIDYTFDANGNLLSEEYIKGSQTTKIVNYSYDPEDRLVQISYPHLTTANLDTQSVPDTVISMIYEGDGKRVKKTSNGGTTIYHYDLANNVICETDQNGQTKSYYIYANGQRICRIDPSGKMFFFHNDALGSPALITDGSGNVAQKYLYEPFGTILASKGKNDNHYTFTGKEYDFESGLFYFGARYYDPKIGRFISRDIAEPHYDNPQTLNRYIYCMNNPLIYVDPDGLDAILYVDRYRAVYFGHMGLYFQDPLGGWWKSDLGSRTTNVFNGPGNYVVTYKPFFNPESELVNRGKNALYIKTQNYQDRLIFKYIQNKKLEFDKRRINYKALSTNCKWTSMQALKTGEINLPEIRYLGGIIDPRPNATFDNMFASYQAFGGYPPSWNLMNSYQNMWAGDRYSWPNLGSIDF